MTTLTIGHSFSFVGASRSGASNEAQQVQERAAKAVASRRDSSYWSGVLDALHSLQDQADQELKLRGSGVVDLTTFALAERFINALPSDVPIPELSIDPDGEIALDWFGINGRNFSVSLGPQGRLSYAGVLKSFKTVHGTDQFDDAIPQEITDAIRALAGSAR